MNEKRFEELAHVDQFASVEKYSTCCGKTVIQVNFMTMSFRMTLQDYEKLTVMLNQAMVQLNNEDSYFKEMNNLFGLYKLRDSLDFKEGIGNN
jgi:hypothetical protein